MDLTRLVTKEDLQNNLNTFYKHYMLSGEFLDELFDTFIDAANILAGFANNIENCKIISNTPAYRIIPIFILFAKTGLYDIDYLKLNNFEFGDWDTLSLAQKVSLLDRHGIYENLTYYKKRGTNTIANIARVEIDRFVEDKYSFKYEEFVDFVLKDNKLYFFGDLAKPLGNVPNQGKMVVLKNIAVDYGDLRHKWGTFTGIPKPPYLSYQAYRNVISILLKTLVDGPKIVNLASAVRAISGWEEALVVDSYTPGVSTYGLALGPFDFAVLLPIDLVGYPDRVEYISYFMRMVKPDYTNYFISYSSLFAENVDEPTDTDVRFNANVLEEDVYANTALTALPFFLDQDFLNTEFMLDAMGSDSSTLNLRLFSIVPGTYDKNKTVTKLHVVNKSDVVNKLSHTAPDLFSNVLGWSWKEITIREGEV